ncbi:GerAB/ArcD/ProY family transporter [Gottfriedia acidiceleris]|uniref:GerAB/ArcD/ProY family transporter n=1 Tax=Gottfriedia acidiceleris TaxID=371036 RepID=UPI003D238F16
MNIRHQISPYLVFFVIYNSQVGVSILSFQRSIATKAGYDAWIGVLAAGCLVQVLIWVMYKLLGKVDGDIIDVHSNIFGNVLGKFFSFFIMIYYWLASVYVLLKFIEIIQVWMFPTIPSWILSTLILISVYYCVSGGFRVVVGMSLLSFIFPQILLIFLYFFPLKMAHFSNLLPIMNHSLIELSDSIKSSMSTTAGTETLLMFYPFIRNPKASKKFAHLGVLFTTLLYTFSAIVTFTFYSERLLKTTIWPELSLTKVITLPFLERFEYLYISMYLIIVSTLIALLLWCSSRGFKKIFSSKQKHILIILSLLSVVICQIINDPFKDLLNKYITQMNLWIFYGYIPILLFVFTFKKWVIKMINRSALLLFLILLLSGCTLFPTSYIVNKIDMSQGLGYDLTEKKDIKGTIVYPIFKKDKASSTEVRTAIGKSSKEIRSILNNETQNPLVSGQVRVALYGKKLAKIGINDFVDTLHRDPSIGSLIQLGIVDGDANQLFKSKKYKKENVSIHVNNMLVQNMEFGQLPRTDLHTFLFQLFQIGQDPYLPLIKNENDNIGITGIAFFKNDQYVTSISLKDLFIFKALVESSKNTLHQFILENGDKVVIETLGSNVKYKVKIVHGRPEFIIHLKMRPSLKEFAPSKKQRVAVDKKKIQKQIEQILEKDALNIVTQFKNHQVDPLGLGAKYREHYPGFNEKKWEMYYPHVKVFVKADVEIRQTGTID